MSKSKASRVETHWTSFGNKVMQAKRTFVNSHLLNMFHSKKWSVILVVMGFLLGRAMILEQLTPFSIAYFAVLFYLRRDLIHWIGVALFLGSLFSLHQHTSSIVVGMFIFMLIQTALQRYDHTELSYAPFLVFGTSFLVRLFMVLIADELSWYMMMLIGVEAVLGFILTLIFIQALPIFTIKRRKQYLTHEEIICLIILIASVMTGAAGWKLMDVSVEHVLSRYLILLFAFVGGAPIGTTVGVLTGLILSLANPGAINQMSLLAFAGLLAGLLKEGNKFMVTLGMLLGTAILSLYIGPPNTFLPSMIESLVAVLLFLITPLSATQYIASYVPGTRENLSTQQDYAKRIRTMLSDRIQQFSEVFHQLANSFMQTSAAKGEERTETPADRLINAVADRACATCWRQNKCWDQNYKQTIHYMTEMMNEIHANPQFAARDMPADWKLACVRTEQMLGMMKDQFDYFKQDLHWRRQIRDSKRLVSDQLTGVSQVMNDLAKEIRREGQVLSNQEEQIRQALQEIGLSIHVIDIYSLDEGNVEIEMIHQYNKGYDECKKIIAPLLSDILGEQIAVSKEKFLDDGEGYCMVSFTSAKVFTVSVGHAGTAKGGEYMSGDNISMMELGNGKYAVAISDGMGNGERANSESQAALSMLHHFLRSGMDEQLAIKSVNSMLLLRSSDEMFATIDVALIDLYSARTTFVKIGSTPSFIKRGTEVITVKANNLPAGIIHDIDVDLIAEQLYPGDVLILMTDGVYDAPGQTVNQELWMKRIIRDINTYEPQDIADILLETVVRYRSGFIHDDMTVVVARIDRLNPEWAAFRWPNKTQAKRPKIVS